MNSRDGYRCSEDPSASHAHPREVCEHNDADDLGVKHVGKDMLIACSEAAAGPKIRTQTVSESKLPHSARRTPSRLLPSSVPVPYARASPSSNSLNGKTQELCNDIPPNDSSISLGHLGTQGGSMVRGNEEDGHLDWYIEGPGKRVGYEDSTTIDWIFEYAKERQRVRVLNNNSAGPVGYVRRLFDAGHVWLVLVSTGILVGVIAAGIDTVTIWLGDVKSGYCKTSAEGGRFYLRREFCCWGHDDPSQCQDWKTWRQTLRIPSQGGAYTVEYMFFCLFSVFFAAISAFLVKHYALFARHSGIPEIKTVLGGFVIRRFLGFWTLVIKSLGLCLAVASGLWLGKEGPYVHIACCCANVIMQHIDTLKNNEARKREIFSAAAASAISVAFGAPIGGVLFSLEQLSYYFPDKTMWQSFVCAMVAAVTLQAIDPFRTGKIVLYQVEYSSGWHRFELLPFTLLGIIGGLYGGLFIRLNMAVAKFRKSNANPLRNSPISEVLLVTILTALINYPNIMMRGQRSELVHSLFSECDKLGANDLFGLCKMSTADTISMVSLLLTASGLGSLLATATFGLQIPAGIILPSIAIGALYGRALGVVVELFQEHHSTLFLFSACEADVPCVTPGTYAIVGAASALAGVTKMTVSIVVIMFELTGALTYVLPIMIAVMVSKWIGDVFSRQGIYESWISFKDYPYLDNRDDTPAPDLTVSDVMTPVEEMVCIDTKEDHSIESLSTLLSTTSFRGFPVILDTSSLINESPRNLLAPFEVPETITLPSPVPSSTNVPQNNLLGYISRTELSFALSSARSPRPRNSSNVLQEWNLPAHTLCFFTHVATASPVATLDLRPWMDQTPITLNAQSSLQLALNMFQRLGLRHLLLVDRGALKGLLTKKDMWWVLGSGKGAEEGRFGPAAGSYQDGGYRTVGGAGSRFGEVGAERARSSIVDPAESN